MMRIIGNLKPRLGIGYCMGGEKSGINYGNLTVDGFSFVTSAAISVGDVLTVARCQQTGAQSSDTAYCFGGINNATRYNEIDGFHMPSGANRNPTAVLNVVKNAITAAQNTINVVLVGGYITGGTATDEIEKMTLSTQTMYDLTAVLNILGYYGIAFNNRYGEPYINSMTTAGNVATSTIYQITTSDGTTVNKGNMLETASWGATGINSDCKGYHISGVGFTTAIDSFLFLTETAANPSLTAVLARRNACGANSLIYGVVMGGTPEAGGNSNEIDGIHFSTETQYNPSEVLSAARYNTAGAQSGGYL